MPRSLKVKINYVKKVKLAVRRNGFPSQRSLAENLGFALATVSKFLTGKPVDYLSGKMPTMTNLLATLVAQSP